MYCMLCGTARLLSARSAGLVGKEPIWNISPLLCQRLVREATGLEGGGDHEKAFLGITSPSAV